ncbi:MAG: hypothetical protein BWY27_01415 [Bacteroidetes bacterium ADurb.Bin234]|nr:MAG: hypothetical protein BWY27_01415 [Bacteroidetes bacterium ADurb.Bin234]
MAISLIINSYIKERNKLHCSFLKIANDFHNSFYERDFKSYALGLLFYRFISKILYLTTNMEGVLK